MDEWNYYITGTGGLFLKDNFINKELLSNIHAIMLTNAVEMHIGNSCTTDIAWDAMKYVNVIIRNPYIYEKYPLEDSDNADRYFCNNIMP